jgi:tight adherence protein C
MDTYLGLGLAGLFAGLVMLIITLCIQLRYVYTHKVKTPPPAIKDQRDDLKAKNSLYKWTITVIEVFTVITIRWMPPKKRKDFEKLLYYSGNPLYLTPDEFGGFKLLSACIFSVVFLWVGFSITEKFNLLLPLLGAVVGFIYPDLWSRDREKIRSHKINMRLPYILDFLVLSMEAGLDFISAVKEITRKNWADDDPLINEFSRMLKEIELGKPRREAVKSLSERISSKYMDTFVNTTIQAEEQGIPLKHAYRQMAGGLRVARQQAAEKTALEAPVKMLFPMMFIFLSTFLVLFGGMIIQFLESR